MVPNEKYKAQAAMLANRVKKRYKHLYKRYKRLNLEVFRLYDWDIPEIRAVVDWYGGHLVVGEYSRKQSTPDWLPFMGKAVAQSLNVPLENLHLKVRKAGIKEGTRYRRINTRNRKIPMWERDLQFLINPSDYVDTGLFSDHRDTRQRVREMARGKDFLNLYCYTGAFTCYAAKGGAASTLSVDRSETAVTWVKENLELNGLAGPAHTQVHRDTFDFLEQAVKQGPSFDLAVVDPPSYSTTRRTENHFDIARDHPRLLNPVFQLMRPGATLFFSTNHQNFELKTHRLTADRIREITDQTIPEDYRNKQKKNPQMLGDPFLMDGIFDPFEKRISRDIRNALSIHFLDLLEKGNWKAFEQKTAPLKAAAPDAGHIRYIEDRVETYRKVFCHTRETPFETALALWKSKLFFECHEWLEPLWLRADGDFKKAVQGIIRAAGAHALDEAGRDGPARSSAQKALILIQTHREKIPPPFDAEKLSGSLKRIINSQAAG